MRINGLAKDEKGNIYWDRYEQYLILKQRLKHPDEEIYLNKEMSNELRTKFGLDKRGLE